MSKASFLSRAIAAATPAIKRARASRWLRYAGHAVALAAAAFILAKFHALGWRAVVDALPPHPGFYVLIGMSYVALPVTELLIYRGLWSVPLSTMPIFFRKRVGNDVLDYAGEVYLYAWIKRWRPRIGSSLRTIRDVNLLSGAVSNAFTLMLTATVGTLLWSNAQTHAPLVAVVVLATAFIVGVLIFARHGFSIARERQLQVTALHAARMAATLGFQTLAWTLAVPDVSLSGWVFVLAAQMLVTRIPFLPQRDLMTAGAVLALVPQVATSELAVSAMFMATAALTYIFHGVVLGITSLPATARLSERCLAQHAH